MASFGETPDVIGFRDGKSTMIECKVSRGDFIADKKKVCRHYESIALGDWRYYCAPKGLIAPDEVPTDWGLLEACGEGLVTRVHPHIWAGRNQRNEIRILMSVIRRIGRMEPEGVSIRCYTHKTKNRATLTVADSDNENNFAAGEGI